MYISSNNPVLTTLRSVTTRLLNVSATTLCNTVFEAMEANPNRVVVLQGSERNDAHLSTPRPIMDAWLRITDNLDSPHRFNVTIKANEVTIQRVSHNGVPVRTPNLAEFHAKMRRLSQTRVCHCQREKNLVGACCR